MARTEPDAMENEPFVVWKEKNPQVQLGTSPMPPGRVRWW
jgi:hypothetical protein